MARKKNTSNKVETVNKEENLFTTVVRHSYYTSEREVRLLIREMIEEAESNKKILALSTLLNKRRINKKAFYSWCNKYPDVMEDKEFILQIFGERREMRGLENKSIPSAIFPFLWMFDPDYDKHDERAARLKLQSTPTDTPPSFLVPTMEQLKDFMNDKKES